MFDCLTTYFNYSNNSKLKPVVDKTVIAASVKRATQAVGENKIRHITENIHIVFLLNEKLKKSSVVWDE